MYRLFFIFMIFASAFSLSGQNNQAVLEEAYQLLKAEKYDLTIALLEKEMTHNPEPRYLQQLLAQTYYWNQAVEKADSAYRSILHQHPGFTEVRLDYGRMLFELGRLEEACDQLMQYGERYPHDVYYLETTGFILYWQGNFPQAQEQFLHILTQYPGHTTSQKMILEIKQLLSPRFRLEYAFHEDTQPLTRHAVNVSVKDYLNPLIQPELSIQHHFLKEDMEASYSGASLSNTLSLFQQRSKIRMNVGYMRHIETQLTWGLEFTQKISDQLSLTWAGEKRPYWHTLSSLNMDLYSTDFESKVNWESRSGIQLESAWWHQSFPMDNAINTGYLWVLVPVISDAVGSLNVGYAYNYSTARRSAFTSQQSIPELIALNRYADLPGLYNPLFTPRNQHIHAAIINSRIHLNKNWLLKATTDLSIYAFADIPYLYLDRSDHMEWQIQEGYSKQNFFTYQFSGDIIYDGASLDYQLTFKRSKKYFYTFNEIRALITFTWLK